MHQELSKLASVKENAEKNVESLKDQIRTMIREQEQKQNDN